MIVLQLIGALVLVFIILIMYAVAIKMLYDHRTLHNTEDTADDENNLDLTNKQ